MKAEMPQPSWWNKFPDFGHPTVEPETYVKSLRQLSQEELADYISYRVTAPENLLRPSIDILHDENPIDFLIAVAKEDQVLGEKITQATAVLFNEFAAINRKGIVFSADNKRAVSQLSWLVSFGLSKIGDNENDLLGAKDSINHLADVCKFNFLNSMGDELDKSTARALLYAQYSLTKEGDPHKRWLDIWEDAATTEGDVKYLKSGWGFMGLALVAPAVAVTKIKELVDRMTSGGTDSANYKMLFHGSSLKLLKMFGNDTARLEETLAQIDPSYAERVISYLKTYVE